jgi:anaerobic C4-dicarboxylate transporter
MGDTFIKGNEKAIVGAISDVANAYPPLFGLFVASVFLYS